jgi:hypothetical protein
MTLGDRLKRWWAPAKWRDEHPEISDGDGFALGREARLRESAPGKRSAFTSPTDTRKIEPPARH